MQENSLELIFNIDKEIFYIRHDMLYIFNCNWVGTRWQLISTHIHTNNTGNVTKQTIQRTQKYIEQHKKNT